MLPNKVLLATLLAVVIAAPAPMSDEIICADKTDCYPVQFEPTDEYKVIREGQQIPQGLDVRIDWQTGEKSAKLADGAVEGVKPSKSNEIIEIVEEDKNKVVTYSDSDVEEDSDIIAIKKAYGSQSTLDIDDSLNNLLEFDDEERLEEALDSLTEHSHNLKDGILITEPIYLERLLHIIGSKNMKLKEMGLRVLAQSLRHNEKALDNINFTVVVPRFLNLFSQEDNSVLQKRYLGVVSSFIQSPIGSNVFVQNGGEAVFLNKFQSLKEDSKVRALEILEDLKITGLGKRDNEEDLKLFKTLQSSLQKDEIKSEHSLEYIFDKLVDLKQSNSDFKTDPDFLTWLVNLVTSKKLVKRDSNGEVEDDSLHKKLLEARHLVFGNPNALRKAFADEL